MFNDELIQVTKSPPNLNSRVIAKVLSVYDGDTITVAYNINDNDSCPFVINVRLMGIDTPEKKTTNTLEKQASLLITKYVSDLVLNKIIHLDIHGWDKYGGRILGNVLLLPNEESLNARLLENKLCKIFDGKTSKQEWTEQELEDIIKRLTTN
jgi:endonuclease YncB( thermonuclease family)